MSNLILKADSLYKSYTSHQAVIDFSLEVSKGEICSLIGQNGAGKSSILRMLAGVFLPDKGVLSLFTEKKIGYLPEERGLYQEMQVLEQLEFLAKLKGLSDQEAKTKSELALDKYGLGDWKKKKIKQLSKGMQQKVQILSTVLHEPELLILDEPFSGLDPVNLDLICSLIADLKAQGTAIIITTHEMHIVEQISDKICFLHKGKVAWAGTKDDLTEKLGLNKYRISLKDNRCDSNHTLESYLLDLLGKENSQIKSFKTIDNAGVVIKLGQQIIYEIEVFEGFSGQELFLLLSEKFEIMKFEFYFPTLEESFKEICK